MSFQAGRVPFVRSGSPDRMRRREEVEREKIGIDGHVVGEVFLHVWWKAKCEMDVVRAAWGTEDGGRVGATHLDLFNHFVLVRLG